MRHRLLLFLAGILLASAGGPPGQLQEAGAGPPQTQADRSAPARSQAAGKPDWLSNARIFIIDGYTYPLTPRLEFDAAKLAETMADMHANVVRIATAGHCDWLIPGTEFKTSVNPGDRDILAECIAACRLRGSRSSLTCGPAARSGPPS